MNATAPRVFISYRREETAAHTGRLYDAIAARFGDRNVFLDVDMAPGVDFVERINQAVGACDVLLAVIGPSWATLADDEGHPRLADPEDFVRLEIETALRRPDVTVIPVLVGGARMPDPDALPASVRALSHRNALELSDLRWRDDIARLARTLEELLEQDGGRQDVASPSPMPTPPRRPGLPIPQRLRGGPLVTGALVLLAACAGVLLLVLGDGGDGGGTPPPGSSPQAMQPSGISPARGSVTLGSNLRIRPSNDHWYCTGSSSDTPCTFALTRLPEALDRPVTAPFDGVVTGWQVRGAHGPIRLVVLRGDIRPGDLSTLKRVQASAERDVRSETRQRFRTHLKIQKGDTVGLQLSIGAYGNAPYSQGASLEIWLPPLGAESRPSESDSSPDYELLYGALIERDRDGDGFGDITEDRCPRNPRRHDGCRAKRGRG